MLCLRHLRLRSLGRLFRLFRRLDRGLCLMRSPALAAVGRGSVAVVDLLLVVAVVPQGRLAATLTTRSTATVLRLRLLAVAVAVEAVVEELVVAVSRSKEGFLVGSLDSRSVVAAMAKRSTAKRAKNIITSTDQVVIMSMNTRKSTHIPRLLHRESLYLDRSLRHQRMVTRTRMVDPGLHRRRQQRQHRRMSTTRSPLHVSVATALETCQ